MTPGPQSGSLAAPPARNAPPATLTLVGSVLMLVHAAVMAIGLAAWARSDQLASWRIVVTMVCVPASLATSAWLWIRPSRLAAIVSSVVLALSLARLGAPGGWSGISYGILLATVLFTVPLVMAAAHK